MSGKRSTSRSSGQQRRTYQTSLCFAPPVRIRPNNKSRLSPRPASISSSRTVLPPQGDDQKDTTPSSSAPSPPSPAFVSSKGSSTQLDHLSSGSDNDGGGGGGAGDGRSSSSGRSVVDLSKKERRRAAAARLRAQKRKLVPSGRNRLHAALEDTDGEDEEEDCEKDNSAAPALLGEVKPRKRLGGGKKSSKKIVPGDASDGDVDSGMDEFIVDSSEDDASLDSDGSEEEEKSTKEGVPTEKRRKVASSDDALLEPSGDDESSHGGVGSDDDNGDGDDDASDHGPMSHAALNFRMQMTQHHRQRDEGLAEIMSANRPLAEREAFAVWLEDLALQADAHAKGEVHVSSPRQQRAASQIERPLCTRRESALGSSAWREEFRNELKSRPVYRSFELPKLAVPDVQRCGACGRSNHNITLRIELSGPVYAADKTWECSRELKHADWDVCLGDSLTTPDSDGEEEEESNAHVFHVGGHCRARTELYHNLLHFKFREFDAIQGILAGDRSNVAIRMQRKENGQTMDSFLRKKDQRRACSAGHEEEDEAAEVVTPRSITVKELMSNKGFVEREYERSRGLVQDAEENWGGSKGEFFKDVVRPGAKGSLVRIRGEGRRRGSTNSKGGTNAKGQRKKQKTKLQKKQKQLEFARM